MTPIVKRRLSVAAVMGLFAAVTPRLASQSPDPMDAGRFETQVLPVFQKNCAVCHNDQNRTSGLSVLSRQSLLAGGNRGPAVIAGRASESLLIRALQHEGDLKMPPTGKLPAETIAALTEWVDNGAPWAVSSTPSPPVAKSKGALHWAFQPVRRNPVPEVRNQAWVRNPIDSFILARLEREKIEPSPEADRRTLIRRLSLDLTGLIPSPGEVERFVNDRNPDAYNRLVERLLASPHYGERWARHWLDGARYADSNGYTRDGARQIWMYRDWVIQALNRDLRYDQFVIEQLAGDLLPNPTSEQIVATGFHRNTPINLEGGVEFEQYRVEAVADRVSTTGRVFLGLTLGCARCHDHKYDPLSQREYYQFYAFFNSIDELGGALSDQEGRKRAFEPILEFGNPEQLIQRDAFRKQLAKLTDELDAYEKTLLVKYRDWENLISAEERSKFTTRVLAALKASPEERTEEHLNVLRRIFSRVDPGYQQRQAGIKALETIEPKIAHTLVMRDLPTPRPTHVLLNGDFTQKGVQVQPGTPAFLLPSKGQGTHATRLDLARWLADPAHPLTPRVAVNRLWQHYFGRGLVETDEDFGLRGSAPSHPDLLGWLASEFVACGWSLKQMHRTIVTSAVYRQSSKHRKELEKSDPENRLLARQTRMRLEAEIVRDVALSAAGLLAGKVGGPSVFPPKPEVAGLAQEAAPWITDKGENRYRRGLYTTIQRTSPHTVLQLFDAPDPTQSCTRRSHSNTPLQALALLNDEAFHEFAQGLARRMMTGAAGDRLRGLRYGFQLCLGRPPKADEEDRLQQFFVRQLDEFRTHPDEARAITGTARGDDAAVSAAWTALARVLLNLDEFITRE